MIKYVCGMLVRVCLYACAVHVHGMYMYVYVSCSLFVLCLIKNSSVW